MSFLYPGCCRPLCRLGPSNEDPPARMLFTRRRLVWRVPAWVVALAGRAGFGARRSGDGILQGSGRLWPRVGMEGGGGVGWRDEEAGWRSFEVIPFGPLGYPGLDGSWLFGKPPGWLRRQEEIWSARCGGLRFLVQRSLDSRNHALHDQGIYHGAQKKRG